MTRILIVGQTPEAVDYSDPALPPGLNAENIQARIDVAAAAIADAGIATLEKHLPAATYDWVVIGGGLRLPPKGLVLFEKVVNPVHRGAPGSAIAFNTRPEDTAEAADRWM